MERYLVEARRRSPWGTAWRSLLCVWTVLCSIEALLVVWRASAARSGSGWLAQLAIDNIVTSALLTRGLVWGAVAAPIGLACVLTRASRTLIAVPPPAGPGSPPLSTATREPPADPGFDWDDTAITLPVIGGLALAWAGVAWLLLS